MGVQIQNVVSRPDHIKFKTRSQVFPLGGRVEHNSFIEARSALASGSRFRVLTSHLFQIPSGVKGCCRLHG